MADEERLNMKIWLDDERPAPKGWTWVKDGRDCIGLLAGLQTDPQQRHELTHMSFDHDLADVHYEYWHLAHNPAAEQILPLDHPVRVEARELSAREMTGYDVLLWMAEHEFWPTEACYVHSHNPVGADKMVKTINRYSPYTTKCRWTPYAPTAEEIAELLDEA
jgi:hypothetical protein